ncbi:MAG TPA: TonB-dependent receptor [Bryobacteraceae bacterium]|nr:TonB-dependent receptor [Bryobacteraceae bacterium]
MRIIGAALGLLLAASGLFAQGDRGTITGTVSDSTGSSVAGATVAAKNLDTGAAYQTESTATGNYTLSGLPAGSYGVSVTQPGFKTFTRSGITVPVAQTVRIDVTLEVGDVTESVTVQADAALLKTEGGETSHNVTTQRLDDLPVLGIGAGTAGSAGIRNPIAVVQVLPGTYSVLNSIVRINGAPSNTMSIRIEGQDATNGYIPATPAQNQPGVDAIQEYAVQTSNFAPEYGQVGGGFFNLTMKSGTNQFHGSAYDYFVNEVLNAGQAFTNDGHGNLIRPVARRNDYGFTVGGPVLIPKVFNGRDKTFFFFNFEQYRETQQINTQAITVPTAAYRNGNFGAALTGRNLCPAANPNCDPLGRPILENTIYDPTTQTTAPNGQLVRNPFPNNTIPTSLLDPVALKVQALIPNPTNPNALVNNGIYPYPSQRVTSIPALKIDEMLSSNDKISFYWSETKTANALSPTLGSSDGLPQPISAALGTYDHTHTYRLNYDRTISPTLLLHVGAGYMWKFFNDDTIVTNYDALTQLGLRGATLNRMFPQFNFPASQPQGGVKNLGTGSNRNIWYQKPTANASLTWVKENHTYKAGAEMRLDGLPTYLNSNTNGSYTFSAAESGLPSTNGQNLSGGSVGLPYASFLLGAVDSVTISNPVSLRLGKQQWGFFIQDSWKVTRKFTLDYGIRYDYSTYLKEQYGRLPDFSPVTPNPSVGGLPGAVVFEGSGPGRCNCDLAHNYPWAVGPRLGAAYQLDSKTVFRAGWGIVYAGTPDNYGVSSSVATASTATTTAFGQPIMSLRTGIPFAPPAWPNFDPGQYPAPGTLTTPKVFIDQNAGRPARQNQWSIGLQREIFPNFAVEAAYVGNRGVWWNAPGMNDINSLTPQRLAAFGININSTAEQQLLVSRLDSSIAAQRGFNKAPYTGFSTGNTVAQSLRPFPQFGSIIDLWSPLGNTWYDSLQVKATKRYSHGLTFSGVFTWQKSLVIGSDSSVGPGVTVGTAAFNDITNRQNNKYISQFDQPRVLNISANYTIPAFKTNRILSWAARDWTLGSLLVYSSGLPIEAPFATNNLSSMLLLDTSSGAQTGTFANRVPGAPLFTQDLNCHCFDPSKTFVLNPAAWTQPAPGQFGTSAAYYNDYRFQRRPVENLSLGRIFRVGDKANLNIRMEFTNVFNRTQMANPTATNAQLTQTRNATTGLNSAGFGWINTTAVAAPSRQGTIVARITF